jgi:hypothetical protein
MYKIIAIFLVTTSLLLIDSIHAQTPVQVVRGKVMDAGTKTGLPGANLVVMNSDPVLGTTTNTNGEFRIEKVPVGRQSIMITFMGYKAVIVPEIMVSSGKENVITVEMEELVMTAKEVEVKATLEKDKPINRMAMISARSFTVDESRRYAGSADDPMRAVSGFAGVAASADVNSNEIVIRGNSPKGLLWRVDGVDIPNPNHYAYVGTSGGGITMFSSQVLSNSDFYTAAFPAEFGNALSGVFDMRFRNGNNARREYALQVGIQGLDLSAEGPFVKGRSSSYLFNYRYSILAFLQYIDPAMKNKMPQYQDASFKLNFPTKKAGVFFLTGIGGISRSTFTPENDSTRWKILEDRTKSTLNNNMGALSLSHHLVLSRNTYLNSYASATYNDIYYDNNYINADYQIIPQENIIHRNYRFTVGSLINHKFGPHHTNRSGIVYSKMFYDLDIKAMNPLTGIFAQYDKGNGNTGLAQGFTESKFSLTNSLELNAGIHFLWFFLNSNYSVEPRFALRWQLAQRHALSFGYGKHSQLEDIGVYLAEVHPTPSTTAQPGRNLDLSRSHHFVLGYDYLIRNDMRLKIETYYQYLYNIPVKPGSYYSLVNSDGWYSNDTLVNKGTGTNKGIDFTFEKFLTKRYYYLATVSVFDSKYKGGDGAIRNTRFNSNYVVNLIGGKEWTIRKKNILGVNLKLNLTGGEYYVPIDLAASILQHREVLNESEAFGSRLPDFYYVDITITYRTNHRKFSGIWAIQIKNLLDQKPATGYVYNDFNKTVEPVRSMGIIPFISYKIEF